MRLSHRVIVFLMLLLPLPAVAQHSEPTLQAELNQLESSVIDSDLKLIVVQSIAEDLGCHRNQLMLLRRESGQSYGLIYISELRHKGLDDAMILQRLRTLNRRLRAASGSVARPSHLDFLFRSGVDRNSAGTFYFAVPEISFNWRRLTLAADIPYYRAYGVTSLNAGLGDVYLTALTRAGVAGLDFTPTLTLGFPTGDTSKGLGAGKATADLSIAIAKRFESVRPWAAAGLTNSGFDNVGYRRPYISDGNAAHFTGGLDFAIHRRISLGVAGFTLRPFGSQTIYGDMMQAQGSSSSGDMPRPGGGMGHIAPGMSPGGSTAAMPFYERSQQTSISAGELADHGASAWVSFPIRPGLVFTTAVARSIPFHLTTVRVGIAVDIGAAFRLRLP
jgi:hypothetical protein